MLKMWNDYLELPEFKDHFWNHIDKKKGEFVCNLCGVKFK